MNTFAIAGLARLVFALSEPSLPPPDPSPLPTAEQSPQQSPSQTSSGNLAEQPKLQPKENGDSVKYQIDKQGDNSRTDWILTLAIAVATIVQAVIAGIQASHMGRTRRSFEIGERAWLFADDFTFSGINFPGDNEISVRYAIHNTGRTAADVYEHVVRFTDEFSDENRLPENPPYTKPEAVSFTVAAGRHFGLSSAIAKSKLPNFAEIEAEKRSLYLLGYLKYWDVFGEEHESRFAIRWRGRSFTVTDVPHYNVDVS